MSTPGPPQLPPSTGRPSRVWIWATLGFVVMALLAWGFGVLLVRLQERVADPWGLGFGSAPTAAPGPPLLQARVEAPFAVSEGAPFAVRILLRNASGQDLELESIDFQSGLHDGFFVRTTPAGWKSTTPGEPVEYFFNETLAPGSSVEKVFECEARTPGLYSGDLDVWNDGGLNSFTTSLEVVPGAKSPAAGPSPGAPDPGP